MIIDGGDLVELVHPLCAGLSRRRKSQTVRFSIPVDQDLKARRFVLPNNTYVYLQ